MKFLSLLTIDECKKIIRNKLTAEKKVEEINLEKSFGRVLAEKIYSPFDVPPFNRSTVDGYAVRSLDTLNAEEESPVKLLLVGKVNVGEKCLFSLKPKTCVYVATGSMIPRGSDSVVMVEYTSVKDSEVSVFRPTYPGENILKAGSDISEGELVLREGVEIGPVEVGLLASIGRKIVKVYKKPRVAIVSTGPEILEPGEPLSEGKVYNINSYTLGALVESLGGEVKYFSVREDNENFLGETLLDIWGSSDMILVIGGSSKGEGDVTLKAVESFIKPELLIHGLSSKPGKPTIVAVKENKLILGLPGQPTSSFTIYSLLAAPFISKLSGKRIKTRKESAVLSRKIFRRPERDEILYVYLVKFKNSSYACPVSRISGHLTLFSLADGYVFVKREVQQLYRGEKVEVNLFPWFEGEKITLIGEKSLFTEKLAELAPFNLRKIYGSSFFAKDSLLRNECHIAFSKEKPTSPEIKVLGKFNRKIVLFTFKEESIALLSRKGKVIALPSSITLPVGFLEDFKTSKKIFLKNEHFVYQAVRSGEAEIGLTYLDSILLETHYTAEFAFKKVDEIPFYFLINKETLLREQQTEIEEAINKLKVELKSFTI